MKRIVLLTTLLVVGAAAGSAWAIDGWLTPRGKSVWGGGRYSLECGSPLPACPVPRDFSLDAHGGARGLGATGSFSWGSPQIGPLIEGRVTCLHVDEDSAKWSIAGGFIDHVNPSFDGWGFFFYTRDLGRAGSATRDLVKLFLFDPSQSPGIPAGFPFRCPSLGEVPLGARAVLDAGDITITR